MDIFRLEVHKTNASSYTEKMNNLFQVDENSIEQYFAVRIVLGC